MISRIIVIDGNIAAGKTSLSHKLSQHYQEKGHKVTCLEESFDEKLLIKYIANPVKYGHKFVIDIAQRKFKIVEAACQGQGIYIIDRSPYGDMAIFNWRLTRNDITIETYELARHILRRACELLTERAAELFYLKVDPATCMKRCRQRARPGENLYNIDYFSEIDLHNDIFLKDHTMIDGTNEVDLENFEIKKI